MHDRESQIHDFLHASFPVLFSRRLQGPRHPDRNSKFKTQNFRLGFDVAASGQGDLAAFYIDEAKDSALWLRALLTCRTEDWHFLNTVLVLFPRRTPHAQSRRRRIRSRPPNLLGSRRQIRAAVSSKSISPAKKHDLGFALMNQLSVAEKRFPRSEQDIAADFFALRKFHTGTRWIFTEGRNSLNPASHCDIAWAAALASHAHHQRRPMPAPPSSWRTARSFTATTQTTIATVCPPRPPVSSGQRPQHLAPPMINPICHLPSSSRATRARLPVEFSNRGAVAFVSMQHAHALLRVVLVLLLSFFAVSGQRASATDAQTAAPADFRSRAMDDLFVLRNYRAGKNSFVESPERHIGTWTNQGFRYTLADLKGPGLPPPYLDHARRWRRPTSTGSFTWTAKPRPASAAPMRTWWKPRAKLRCSCGPGQFHPRSQSRVQLLPAGPLREEPARRCGAAPAVLLALVLPDGLPANDASMAGARLVTHGEGKDLSFSYLGLESQQRQASASTLPRAERPLPETRINPGDEVRLAQLNGPAIVRELRLRWPDAANCG